MRKLVGKVANNMKKIDIEAMKEGKQLNVDQYNLLTAHATEKEIHDALKNMSDLTELRSSPLLKRNGECHYHSFRVYYIYII